MNYDDEELGFGLWAFVSLLFLGLLLLGCIVASQFDGAVGGCGIAGLIFLAAAMVGALLGFIFAVPRVIANEASASAGGDARGKLLSTNTNLERISDWLTTMLVGVGLSQLTNLGNILFEFRQFLAGSVSVYVENGQRTAGIIPTVGPFILVLGAASGFLFMYLMTRLVLVGFFRESEEKLSGVAVAAIQVAVTQSQVDQHAGQPSTATAEMPVSPGVEGPQAVATGEDSAAGQPAPTHATAAAFQHASQATSLSNDDALAVMFGLLYEVGGYRRVIQMSGELSRTPIAKRADYWFYLAAAFGQAMHHSAEGSGERLSARDNALDAAQRAVRLDKTFRGRLWEISNPNSTDNDLALLRDDPEFLKLVGRAG